MLVLNIAYSQNKLFLTAQEVLKTLCSQMNKEENFGSALNYFRFNSEGHTGGTSWVITMMGRSLWKLCLKTGGFPAFGEEGNFIYVTWEAIVEWEKFKPGKEQKTLRD